MSETSQQDSWHGMTGLMRGVSERNAEIPEQCQLRQKWSHQMLCCTSVCSTFELHLDMLLLQVQQKY